MNKQMCLESVEVFTSVYLWDRKIFKMFFYTGFVRFPTMNLIYYIMLLAYAIGCQ